MHGMTIGDVARRAAVHVETLRYYERRGLVARPPRSAGNYRLYPEEALGRVRFVKRAQELGFSLEEIRQLLALRATPGARARDVRTRASAKLADVRRKVRELRRMEKALTRLIAGCTGTGSASRCTILEALDSDQVLS
jgi:MerR family mercuric resistance operon transcriptional regulator